MAIFSDGKKMEEIFGEIWEDLIKNEGLGDKLVDAGINILFIVNDPEVIMYVDENGPVFGDEANKKTAVVTMKMAGDTVHKFWLKQVNVPKALALKQIKAKGPIPKVLKLLPLLKPGQEKYPSYCEKHNLPME
jgi:putative sterol carrier protein